MTEQIVLATGNRGKLAEIRQLLTGGDLDVRPQSAFGVVGADETGDTFIANALLKARHATAETGLIAIADDSGLAVDSLDGAPGVYSARYAGADASDADNVQKLLGALQDVAPAQRGASFHCVVVAVFPDERIEPLVGRGEWSGRIAERPTGSAGFGYDPVFFDPELGVCAAEMSAEQKNARSHRGQAFRQLAPQLLDAIARRN